MGAALGGGNAAGITNKVTSQSHCHYHHLFKIVMVLQKKVTYQSIVTVIIVINVVIAVITIRSTK